MTGMNVNPLHKSLTGASTEAQKIKSIKDSVSQICTDTLKATDHLKATGKNSILTGAIKMAQRTINDSKDIQSLQSGIKKVQTALKGVQEKAGSFGKAKKLKDLLETENKELNESLETLDNLQKESSPRINFPALSPEEQNVAKKIRNQFVDKGITSYEDIDSAITAAIEESLPDIEDDHLQIIIEFVKHHLK